MSFAFKGFILQETKPHFLIARFVSMKRRFFIQGTTLGTIGLGIMSPDLIALPVHFEYGSVATWLRQMSWTLGVNRRSSAISAPESFRQVTSGKNDYFANHGYHPMSETCYFFGDDEQYCFYPLVARHTASGTSDLLLPVYRRNSQNEWQPVQTLSGFQVEALIKASHALREKSPAMIQSLLLPIGKVSTGPGAGTYATREGTVSIFTEVKNGRTSTTCTVRNRDGKVFHETFSSSHSLAC